jgi:2-methylcitrate dehydratase PrpD
MATQELAQFVVDLSYDQLPPATCEMAKKCILDWLGCSIRGSVEQPAVIMRRVLAASGGIPEATVFSPALERTSALFAALFNGAASHALDYDDLHNASIIHLGTVVIPAAFAVAEQTDASGRELITAVVAGYELGARIGEAVNPDAYDFWHTTGTAGTFGAAAAAAKLLGLDTRQTVDCLGSAGTQAAGLWEFLQDGAMSKTLHAGKAAMNGILAAMLAKQGFTGAKRILEGEKGFCRSMTPRTQLERLTNKLTAGGYKIDENSFKPFACCKHCHSAVNAVQEIRRRQRLDYRQATAIHIRTNAVANNLVNNPAPENTYACKFSMQYCTAAMLRYGALGVDEFAPDKATDTALRRLMDNTVIQVDPELDEDYRRNPQKWSTLVTIKTSDGQEYEQFIAYPKGDPQNPVTYQEAQEKFRSLSQHVYRTDQIDKLSQMIANLVSVEDLRQNLAICLGR